MTKDEAIKFATELRGASTTVAMRELCDQIITRVTAKGEASAGQIEMLRGIAKQLGRTEPVKVAPAPAAVPSGKRPFIWMGPKAKSVPAELRERAAIHAVSRALPPNVDLRTPDAAGWEQIRAAAGGWGGMQDWVMQHHHGLVVFETAYGPGSLSRVVGQTAQAFIEARKPVILVNHDVTLCARVKALERTESTDRGSWQENYMIVTEISGKQRLAPLAVELPARERVAVPPPGKRRQAWEADDFDAGDIPF